MVESETISIRLSVDAIKRLGIIATREHVPLRTLIQSFIMKQLDLEEGV